MNMLVVGLMFAVGIILIVKGGDSFVDAAGWIAEVSGIPKFIIGATIVSVATTLPEMFVSLIAATAGKVDMSIGNAVGSVTANVGLIMGISIVCLPSILKRSDFLFKSLLLIGVAALLYTFCLGGQLTVWESVLMLAFFAVYMINSVSEAKAAMDHHAGEKRSRALQAAGGTSVIRRAIKTRRHEILVNGAKFVFGAAAIVIGAKMLVDSGSEIARWMGVPEGIIGVTFIAIGTSLPELVTAVTAIIKKQSSLSVGNIIGANIIDLAVILPLCTLISGNSLPVGLQSVGLDMPVCLLILCIGLIPPLIIEKFKRIQGILLLGAYSIYMAAVYTLLG